MLMINILWQALSGLFGAAEINLADINLLQAKAPDLMLYALPAVFVFTIIEFLGSYFGEHKTYEQKETLGSLLIGLGNLTVNLLMKVVLVYVAICLYNLFPWRMMLNWYMLIPCFIVYDFCSYWSHRISHYNRFFWATHVVHHSAEHYNLTVAFRQSWVQHFKVIFFIPVILVGFHPVIFMVVSQLSTLYQFWVHTEAIGKLHPFIEKYFGTPSNHRVHHGSQEKYLDKNFGATFMIWDHLFKSFQYEEEKPIYGLTTPVSNKTNPFILNFQEYIDMFNDVKKSKGLKDALFFIFASPGKIYNRKLITVPIAQKRSVNKMYYKVIVMLAVFLLLLTSAVRAQQAAVLPTPVGKNLLFFLQRTPDANTVIYEINFRKDGTIDPEKPVVGSWIRYEENQKYKPLTGIEQRFAYGVKCKALGKDEFEIRLVAYKKMPLYLLKSGTDNCYKMYIKNGEENLLLKRVFVKVDGGSFWFPKVQYIDLITAHSETGKEIIKRIAI
jgi:sterol desaturase/sphingolipid hydroxylase (fatty acid hydroxylase superfamily)